MKLDFDSVNYCVKQLREAADDCVEVGKSCKNKTNSTESTWKGKTADQFRNRMTKWSRETDKIGDELDAMASKILRVAKQMREKDQEAAQSISSSKPAVSDRCGVVPNTRCMGTTTLANRISAENEAKNVAKNVVKNVSGTVSGVISALLGGK